MIIKKKKTELFSNFLDTSGTIEFTIDATEELIKMFNRFKHISQKRFRKLLYSIGYGRNVANNIIDITWRYQGYYTLNDIEYWKKYFELRRIKYGII